MAAIIGVIYFYKYKNTALKYFLLLLWYVTINDIIGMYLREKVTHYNAIIYNIYYVVNFTYLLLLYRAYLSNKKSKVVVLTFTLIYLFSFIVNGFFENYLIEFQRFPYIIAALFLIITVILYFSEVLNSEKVLHAKKNLLFWISVGLLLYYVGNIPFRIIRNYYQDLADATILFLVNLTLGIVMYICFIIGFLWSDKKQQY
ncbi:hypothetical protein [Aquimarina sp. MMG016]|uniref:hypothetical protein n=1 Tax=Aquimarina sp. MMG016 TaxID=2822690 RepID=UPI001B3A554B|nr:hypothetical protein [Aquimarina sp. MMG016]MBQ4818756.1 hypothetical protein [Aquimarina sp. MMG016]